MRKSSKLVGFKIISNRIIFILFYIAIFIGIGVGGYFIYLSFYDFYFDKDEIQTEIGEKTNSGMVTKRAFEVADGDYIYTIADQSIARVDKHGNVIGISEGETELEVKYKHSLTSKKIKVIVSDEFDDDEENDDDIIDDISLPD